MKNFILSTLGIIAGFIVIIIGTYMSMSIYNRGKYASVAEMPVDESANTSSAFNSSSASTTTQASSVIEPPQQTASNDIAYQTTGGAMSSRDQSLSTQESPVSTTQTGLTPAELTDTGDGYYSQINLLCPAPITGETGDVEYQITALGGVCCFTDKEVAEAMEIEVNNEYPMVVLSYEAHNKNQNEKAGFHLESAVIVDKAGTRVPIKYEVSELSWVQEYLPNEHQDGMLIFISPNSHNDIKDIDLYFWGINQNNEHDQLHHHISFQDL